MTRVFVSPDYTGTNPYQHLLADALRERGVSVETVEGGPLMPLRALRDRGRPDVLHLHWLHPFLVGQNAGYTLIKGALFLSQLLVLRALGVRVVWTVHNLVEHDARNPRLERALRHALARVVDAGIVHCDRVVDRVLTAYRLPDRYCDRFRVIPHGHYLGFYPDDVSRADAREELGLDDAFTFLFFGRVSEYKNVAGLVDAFGDVDRTDARLIVAGSPTDEAVRARIEALAAADDRVETHLEFVPEDRVQYYLNAADVAVFPFREILTSGSAVLAMSFGRPVVVPDVGCVGAVVPDDGGFTYSPDGRDGCDDPDDYGGLRPALERAMAADLERVGRRNREAVARLDWDSVARRTAVVYDAA